MLLLSSLRTVHVLNRNVYHFLFHSHPQIQLVHISLLILTTLNFLFPWINHFLIVPSDSFFPLPLPHPPLVNVKYFSVLFLKCRYKYVLLLLFKLFAIPMDCSPPGSSVHILFQARVLEWVAISFSKISSWSRDQTHISCVPCIVRADSLPLCHLLESRI